MYPSISVYQGYASRFIHRLAPQRHYYLFDTFSGFDTSDLEKGVGADLRFRDTSLEAVLRTIGDTRNIEPRKGRVRRHSPDSRVSASP